MDAARPARHASSGSAKVTNREGRARCVIVCDHASNFIPRNTARLGSTLPSSSATSPGIPARCRSRSAWRRRSTPFSSILRVAPGHRLQPAARRAGPDPAVSETTEIPGNRDLGDEERAARIALAHAPFHDAIDDVVAERLKAGRATQLVSVHSFTPVYKGVRRPWHIGIIHDDDRRLAAPLIEALETMAITVGVNQPYSPADRVYYTLERHARSRGLPCAMIEIRNDEIEDSDNRRNGPGGWRESSPGMPIEEPDGEEAGRPRRA